MKKHLNWEFIPLPREKSANPVDFTCILLPKICPHVSIFNLAVLVQVIGPLTLIPIHLPNSRSPL